MYRNFQYIPNEFLDSLKNPIAVLTGSFTFSFVNTAFCNLFKKKKKNLENSSLSDVFESVDLSRLMPEIRRAFNGESVTTNFNFQATNGKQSFYLNLYPQYDEKEIIDGLLLQFEAFEQKYEKKDDCTEVLSDIQKDSQQENELRRLKEVERMFNIIAEYSNDFIYITDMDQNFTYLSPSVEKFLGYSLSEAFNLHVKDIMTEESYNYQLNLFKSHLEQFSDNLSNVTAIDQIEQVRKDGTKFWSEANASLI